MNSNIKKSLALLGAIFLLFNLSLAQPEPDDEMDPKRKEKIDILKRSFITEKIQLTVNEAEKFWPLYNEREVSKEAVRKVIKEKMVETKKNSKDERAVLNSIDFITLFMLKACWIFF